MSALVNFFFQIAAFALAVILVGSFFWCFAIRPTMKKNRLKRGTAKQGVRRKFIAQQFLTLEKLRGHFTGLRLRKHTKVWQNHNGDIIQYTNSNGNKSFEFPPASVCHQKNVSGWGRCKNCVVGEYFHDTSCGVACKSIWFNAKEGGEDESQKIIDTIEEYAKEKYRDEIHLIKKDQQLSELDKIIAGLERDDDDL